MLDIIKQFDRIPTSTKQTGQNEMNTYEYQTKDRNGSSLTCSERFDCIEKCVDALKVNMEKVDLTATSATIAKFNGKGKVKILSRCKRVGSDLCFRSA